MPNHVLLTLTCAVVASGACQTTSQPPTIVALEDSRSTSVLGHWILATPTDSSAFSGAKQVDLVLSPSSFALTVAYPGRSPLTASGRVDLSQTGLLTLTPTTISGDGAAMGLTAGQPFTRLVTTSGSTLVLAPPSATVPSSVWYRLETARFAGLVPK